MEPKSPLSQRHAFLSYVHEDRVQVDALQEALEAAGVAVWRDTKDLWPGEDWELRIRSAIKADALAFVACFSKNSQSKGKSYQNAELALAAEEYRLRPPSTQWLLPVRFDECEVPEFSLGAGRTLGSLQRTDLFGDGQVVQTIRLLQTVQQIISPVSTVDPAIAAGVTARRAAESPQKARADRIKALLRDPNGDILLEDLVMDVARNLRDRLADADAFPSRSSELESNLDAARFWIGQVEKYNAALEPALELVVLGAMYGQPRHSPTWTLLIETVATTTVVREGHKLLVSLRDYPLTVLLYAAVVAAVAKRNFDTLVAFASAPEIRLEGGRVPVAQHTGPRFIEGDFPWIASALALSKDGNRVVDEELVEGLKSRRIGARHTPMSDYLYGQLKPIFADYFPDERDYADAFDLAEIYLDLISEDAQEERAKNYWGPSGGYGRYTWRHKHSDNPPEVGLKAAMDSVGQGWSPLVAGLFDGSVQRASKAFDRVAEVAASIRKSQW